MNSPKTQSPLLTAEPFKAWVARSKSIEERSRTLDQFEGELKSLFRKYGYRDYDDYVRQKANLVAELEGKPPPKYPFLHRRRTREDERQILELVKAGVRNKDIARRLGFAENTISNVKKVLRDQGLL